MQPIEKSRASGNVHLRTKVFILCNVTQRPRRVRSGPTGAFWSVTNPKFSMPGSGSTFTRHALTQDSSIAPKRETCIHTIDAWKRTAVPMALPDELKTIFQRVESLPNLDEQVVALALGEYHQAN